MITVTSASEETTATDGNFAVIVSTMTPEPPPAPTPTGSGDMLAQIYDPTRKAADCFNLGNMGGSLDAGVFY